MRAKSKALISVICHIGNYQSPELFGDRAWGVSLANHLHRYPSYQNPAAVPLMQPKFLSDAIQLTNR